MLSLCTGMPIGIGGSGACLATSSSFLSLLGILLAELCLRSSCMWAVLQFSFWSGGRIAPPFPWGLSDNGLVSEVCLFTVGIPLPEAKWCQAFFPGSY